MGYGSVVTLVYLAYMQSLQLEPLHGKTNKNLKPTIIKSIARDYFWTHLFLVCMSWKPDTNHFRKGSWSQLLRYMAETNHYTTVTSPSISYNSFIHDWNHNKIALKVPSFLLICTSIFFITLSLIKMLLFLFTFQDCEILIYHFHSGYENVCLY